MAGISAMLDDQVLVDLARGGDLSVREELFRRHYSVAYRVARRALGHDEDALDAVQDGFLKAVRHLHDFDGRSGFRTWLLKIVTNAALDLGRKRRRRPACYLDEATFEDSATAFSEDPSLRLRREDLRRDIDAALAKIRPEKRLTFVLFAEAGQTYKEIAEIQNIPVGTVMSRINDVRSRLQAHLDGAEL
jgi:RNA polymerase sigma-70 factor (ECF subfamily)